ncbi:MAG: DNA-formamidopyrimidine glycosylase family protein [Methylococcaceae bacterium]|nr:DNA-formamidopyrimidine glycosylase family protein [Prolixibacteraceae bacterium]
MPEGPSIVLLKEEVQQFTGEKIISVKGNSKIEQNRLIDQQVVSFKSWGKHFLICLEDFTVRIHFLMFGTYRINEEKIQPVRLSLIFNNGVINFYSCSIKILEEDINSIYDFSADVMSNEWSPRKAKAKLKRIPEELACDALLEQSIFSGVGNIIKNEVLYRIRVHPESLTGKLPEAKARQLIREARIYSFEFLEWKRNFELKKHWLAHTKKVCLRCNLPFVKKHTGKKDRRSFFCIKCQKLYI